MSISIITDGTVQFPDPVFDGRKFVSILPVQWELNGKNHEFSNGTTSDLPSSLIGKHIPQIKENSKAIFQEQFELLGPDHDGILSIVNSSRINNNYINALAAAEEMQGKVPIRVVDSHNISLALGMIIQRTAEQAARGLKLVELELVARNLIPRIYSVLCIPSLSYLERRGIVNNTQALVAEHLGMLPVFTMDKGELVHSEKARNKRHLVDILHEFLTEFGDLEHISLLQGNPSFEIETRALRERLAEDHADTPISEQNIGAQIASIIGPHSLGVFALQRS